MLSRENKIIKDKIDSLQQLPAGYAPNLFSKWEIVEAGLPEKKKTSIPLLMRWSVAAAFIAAMFFIGVKINQHTAPSIGLGVVAHIPLNSVHLLIEKTQAAVIEKPNLFKNIKIQKKQAVLPETTIESIVKLEQIELVKDKFNSSDFEIKVDSTHTINNEVATITPQPEVPKRVIHRTYQKDFNDGLLVMDTAYSKPSNQQFSFKLQLLHKSTADDNQPARRMQLKQVL